MGGSHPITKSRPGLGRQAGRRWWRRRRRSSLALHPRHRHSPLHLPLPGLAGVPLQPPGHPGPPGRCAGLHLEGGVGGGDLPAGGHQPPVHRHLLRRLGVEVRRVPGLEAEEALEARAHVWEGTRCTKPGRSRVSSGDGETPPRLATPCGRRSCRLLLTTSRHCDCRLSTPSGGQGQGAPSTPPLLTSRSEHLAPLLSTLHCQGVSFCWRLVFSRPHFRGR